MMATNNRTVTVFGGTGFLGRRVVRHLRSGELRVRVASRHPDHAQRLFGHDDPQLQAVQADIQHERSVADALAGAYGVVNAVSLYVEQGQKTFFRRHWRTARVIGWLSRLAMPCLRIPDQGSRGRNSRERLSLV